VFDDMTVSALHTALSGLSLRQRVIADNIANIETPGYQARRVQFEDALQNAVGAGTSPAEVAPSIGKSLEPTRENGNNVNLDRETLLNIDTNLRYQLGIRAVDDRFGLLKEAIKGGGA
jgi:flagellar basal-body rod protein FlgB